MFDSSGYKIKFIQKDRQKLNDKFIYCYVYKFQSKKTNFNYIIRAEYHEGDVFAVKFYPQKLAGHDKKYSLILNLGDVPNILITCAKVISPLLQYHPTASFSIIGARTIDFCADKVEKYENNQRFRVYRNVISKIVGDLVFQHIEDKSISAYLLLNRNIEDMDTQIQSILNMFNKNYSDNLHTI